MRHRPNVVIIVLDSVRFDRTSLASSGRDTTPNIKKIAQRSGSVSYDTAISHGKFTATSTGSLLTGKYPAEHGFGYRSNILDSSTPTVAEAFQGAGYTTHCVSNNAFITAESGFDRGFDEFKLLPTSPTEIVKSVGIGTAAKFLLNIRRHSAGFQTDIKRHSGAYLLNSLVESELSSIETQSDPFFLYTHFNEPHRPYYPPLAWFETYTDRLEMSPREAGEFSMDVHNNLVEKVADGCPFSEDEWEALKALYDAEVRYTDMFVGSLFERIQQSFDNTIFVITADHGEHFGEHGVLAHRYVLDDSLLRIPLVINGLDIEATDTPVQHTDVMRTILRVAGADAAFVDGIDLRSKTREFAVSQDGEVSLEPLFDSNDEFKAKNLFFETNQKFPERTSIRTSSYRYIRATDGSYVLYDLPDETQDISDKIPEKTTKMDKKLEIWFDNHQLARPMVDSETDDQISYETKKRLKQMGYLEEDL